MAAPMDMNIPYCEKKLLAKKAIMAYKLGYEVIAINNCLPELLNQPSKGKKKEQIQILHPSELKIDEELLKSELGNMKKPLRQLSRISTVLWNTDQAHLLTTDKVQMYDIIAVQPTSEKTFHQACVDLNIDIVSLDVTEKCSFKIRRPTINSAIERGIHFELMYTPALRDMTMRRYLISVAESLMFYGKGKNIILTSGCDKPIELRGPHDVANLGTILFLSEGQAKNSITTNCRSLLCHSKARRTVQSVLQIEKKESLSTYDTWLLDKCKVDIVSDTQQEGECLKETNRDKKHSETEKKSQKHKIANENITQSDEPQVKKLKS